MAPHSTIVGSNISHERRRASSRRIQTARSSRPKRHSPHALSASRWDQSGGGTPATRRCLVIAMARATCGPMSPASKRTAQRLRSYTPTASGSHRHPKRRYASVSSDPRLPWRPPARIARMAGYIPLGSPARCGLREGIRWLWVHISPANHRRQTGSTPERLWNQQQSMIVCIMKRTAQRRASLSTENGIHLPIL